jgi:hypothetical protein
MRRKFLYLVVVAVIAMAASWNVSRSMSEEALLSDVALANVEALAEESVRSVGCCPLGGYCIIMVNGSIIYSASGESPCSGG